MKEKFETTLIEYNDKDYRLHPCASIYKLMGNKIHFFVSKNEVEYVDDNQKISDPKCPKIKFIRNSVKLRAKYFNLETFK